MNNNTIDKLIEITTASSVVTLVSKNGSINNFFIAVLIYIGKCVGWF